MNSNSDCRESAAFLKKVMLSKAGKKHITDRIEFYEKQRGLKTINPEEIERRIRRLKIWLEK